MTRVAFSVRLWIARPKRLVLAGAFGASLIFASTAYAVIQDTHSPERPSAPTSGAPALTVSQISVSTARGRIVGAATIVNRGTSRVRSTTGMLALSRGSRGEATGVLTFPVRALAAGASQTIHLASRGLSSLPVSSGTYRVLVCTDIDGQLARFAHDRNCSSGRRLVLSPTHRSRPAGPTPKTTIVTRLPRATRPSTPVLRFASTVRGSTFQCRLDGAPWLACRSPQRYTGLIDGRHSFAVRAISPSGKRDPTPAHLTWTTDTTPPTVTLTTPASGSEATTRTPTLSGAAGTAPGDSPTIRVELFSGSRTSTPPLQTLSTTSSNGRWSVVPSQSLANGTYTVQAEQSDSAGNTGLSVPATFDIDGGSGAPAPRGTTTTSTTPTTPRATPTTPTTTITTTTTTSTTPTTTTTTPTTPSTYSVGGSVRGLSGTLTLEDNGGDDLTLSSDGAFTFDDELATGTKYAVTVTSSPAGQTCEVSDTTATGTVGSADITNVAVTCVSSQDDFNRADGDLGANWTPMSDGPLSIASQEVVGTAATAGDIWTGTSYGGDQYSQIEVTQTALTDGQWVGASVRAQNNGQDMYVGMYVWNNGSGGLQIWKRNSGTFTELGQTSCNALAPGTRIAITAVGSQISLLVNGTSQLSVTDSTITKGAPGVMTEGGATVDDWVGGTEDPSLQATYAGSDANGVASYDFTSADDGYGSQVVRVLTPTDPAPGVPHNFLYVLPVESGLGTTYGDGMETMVGLAAQNKYNLTIVEPTFSEDPWYADDPNDPSLQYETFMTNDLVPWVTQNFSEPGQHEQNWLIGFSKSGLGAQDLILKHPDVFALAASWDFPADMTGYDQYESDTGNNYGTQANYQDNYELTQSFLDAHKAAFLTQNRIWIGGYQAFEQDVAHYDTLLTSEGIQFTAQVPEQMAHGWDSGWVANALSSLSQDSAALPATP